MQLEAKGAFVLPFVTHISPNKALWLSQNKARYRSKHLHSRSLYYQAKPDLHTASLLKRVFKIQVLSLRGAKSYKVKSTKSKAFTGACGWQTQNDLVKETALEPLSKGQESKSVQDCCFRCDCNQKAAFLQGCTAILPRKKINASRPT